MALKLTLRKKKSQCSMKHSWIHVICKEHKFSYSEYLELPCLHKRLSV